MIDLERHRAILMVVPAAGWRGATADEISASLVGRGIRDVLAELALLRDGGVVQRYVHDRDEDPQRYPAVARWTLTATEPAATTAELLAA